MTREASHPGVTIRALASIHGIPDQKKLADALGVSRIGLNRLLNGRRAVSPMMALRLEALFGEPARVFLEEQNIWDLKQTFEQRGHELEKIRVNRELLENSREQESGTHNGGP